MYKKAILLFLITAVLIPAVLSFNPIRGFFTYTADKELVMYVDVENPTNNDLDNVQLKAFNDELGLRLYTSAFDLDANERVTKRMQGDVLNEQDGFLRVQAIVGGKKIGTKYIPVDLY